MNLYHKMESPGDSFDINNRSRIVETDKYFKVGCRYILLYFKLMRRNKSEFLL